jgi:tRNA(fMet)-specific endonuclease VapC
MRVLLDTNLCIAVIKQKPLQVQKHLYHHSVGDVGLSSITLAELQFGVERSLHQKRNQQALDEFLLPLVIADFDAKAAGIYGKVRCELERKGTPIGSLDTLIAAHALSLNVTLVTNNLREFRRVANLKVVDWTS